MPHASSFSSLIHLSSHNIFSLCIFCAIFVVWFSCFPSINSYKTMAFIVLPYILCCFILFISWLLHFSLWQNSFLGLLLPAVIHFVSIPRRLSYNGHIFKPISQRLCPRISLIRKGHLGKYSQGGWKKEGQGTALQSYTSGDLTRGKIWNKRCKKSKLPFHEKHIALSH